MTALTESGLLRLVGLTYEAATDNSSWPVFLKAYAEAVSSQVAAMQVHHFNERRSEILATSGMVPRFKESLQFSSRPHYFSFLPHCCPRHRRRAVSGKSDGSYDSDKTVWIDGKGGGDRQADLPRQGH
jgi:hypothetical protein